MAITNQPLRKLPIGVQSFENLRQQGYLYVDKTALIYRLVTTGCPYLLSRPRRFGKSLLLSTLKAYFQGKKELFEGLEIAELEQDWTVHPVLHMSLNAERYNSPEMLAAILERQLKEWEELYDTDGEGETISGRFMTVIKKAQQKTGQQVVVLIDEYDKPLLESMHNKELQDQFRSTLVAFYSVLKDADPYLKFILITGITKFGQLSIFSTLNQLSDISMVNEFSSICGLTRQEIENTFTPELEALAVQEEITLPQVMSEMTRMYDGYRFTQGKTEGLFNPFSVLSALRYQQLSNYWAATGTPTFLVNILQQTDYDLRNLDGVEVSEAGLMNYLADTQSPIPMIYQSGYLTIKSYDREFFLYQLGYPNAEVKYSLLNYMLPYYTPLRNTDAPFYIGKFVTELRAGEVDAFMTRFRAFFAGITYELSDDTERHYQAIFYIVLTLLGQFTQVEVRSSHGRADAVIQTPNYIYVFEFKLNGTAEEALKQIDEKEYLIPYTADSRKLIKVGADFDKDTRNIGQWLKG